MNKEKYAFAQLVEFLNNDRFRRIVAKYHGDVAIVQHDLKLDISTYEMLQKHSVTFTEKTPLRELFAKPKISDVKDQFDPNEQLLLNF